MRQLLGILLILAIGLVMSHRWFGRVKRWGASRFFYLTGQEFLVLGVLLGPSATAMVDQEALVSLEPFVGLGLGYIGFVFGMQFRPRDLSHVPPGFYRATLLQNAIQIVAITVPVAWALGGIAPGVDTVVPLTMVLVATGLGTSTSFLYRVDHGTRLGRFGFFRLMRFCSVFDDLFGVTLFGLALCVWRQESLFGTSVPALEWLAVSLALGGVAGLFLVITSRLGLGEREDLLFLLGVVLFSGGLSAYLRLSPVFTNFVAGVLFCNLHAHSRSYHDLLLRVEKPLYLFLLILAGAMWRIEFAGLFAILGTYVSARLVGKSLGCRVAAGSLTGCPGGGSGLGLAAQSEMSVAMGINLMVLHQDPLSRMVVSAVFLGIVVNDLVGSSYFSWSVRRA